MQVVYGDFPNSTAAIDGSPFTATIQAAEEDNTVDRAASVVTSAAAVLVAGANLTFRVKLLNQFGEPKPWSMTYGPLLASWSLDGGASQSVALHRDALLLGEYGALFFSTTAGGYSVAATLGDDGQPLGSTLSFTVVPAATSEARVTIAVPGIIAGETVEVLVSSYDRFGNLQSYWPATGYDEYEVELQLRATSGSRILPGELPQYKAEVRHQADGHYMATVRLTISGEYHVSAKLFVNDVLNGTIEGAGDLDAFVQPAALAVGETVI